LLFASVAGNASSPALSDVAGETKMLKDGYNPAKRIFNPACAALPM
jgi:hypothetical protein